MLCKSVSLVNINDLPVFQYNRHDSIAETIVMIIYNLTEIIFGGISAYSARNYEHPSNIILYIGVKGEIKGCIIMEFVSNLCQENFSFQLIRLH